jgi:hypothetical protein
MPLLGIDGLLRTRELPEPFRDPRKRLHNAAEYYRQSPGVPWMVCYDEEPANAATAGVI